MPSIPSPLPRLLQRSAQSPHGFRPFVVAGLALGQINPALAAQLQRWPNLFTVTPQAVELSPQLRSIESRSSALAEVARRLYQDRVFSGWRDETYTVWESLLSTPLFHLERAAMRAFGLTMHAVHINGVVGDCPQHCRMWLARRSLSKPIDPDLYDTVVGGGLATGLDIAQTVVKESWEEAGIPGALARQARPNGTVRVRRLVPEGWHDEIIFVHDLWLPAEFRPANQDGEVSAFVQLPLDQILHLVSDTDEVTVDASFIICDFLLRCGFIPPAHPDYRQLQALLRA